MTKTVLHIDSSARATGSVTRELTADILAHLGETEVIRRDLTQALPTIDEEWVGANFTPADARSDAQKQKLALSDSLIAELAEADVLVIGTPVYNFSVPTPLKSWIDMVLRVGETFQYTETGPEGLMKGKRAIIAMAAGGTPAGSDLDFATTYLRFILGFIGITDVQVIAADQQATEGEAALSKAKEAVAALAA